MQLPSPTDLLDPLFDLFRRERRRRAIVHNGRAHIELRSFEKDDTEDCADQIETSVSAADGVNSAAVNLHCGRLIVDFDETLTDLEALTALVDAAEHRAGTDERHLPEVDFGHPADDDAVNRVLFEAFADATAIGVASVARRLRLPRRPVQTDIAAVISFLQNIPWARKRLEGRFGHPKVEVVLVLANAVSQSLAQGVLGPAVDMTYRGLKASELGARRAVWFDLESDLHGPDRPAAAESRRAAPMPKRPTPLPDGPIERYSDMAWLASLGAAAAVLPLTGSFERAASALSAGMPKAAKLGREAFAAQLGRVLADREVISMRPNALRRLDRVDTVVVSTALDEAREPTEASIEDVLRVARQAELRIEIVEGDLCAAIMRHQREGHVVMALAGAKAGSAPAHRVADVAVGIVRPGAGVPWYSDVVCAGGTRAALFMVEAAAVARNVSRQSTGIAGAGASVGAFLAVGRWAPGTVPRVLSAVDISAIAAMLNGVRAGASLGHRPLPRSRDATAWHELEIEEVVGRLGSDTEAGLVRAAAIERRAEPAETPVPAPLAFGRTVWDELANPLTPVLAVGAGLSFATGSVTDALMVGSVLGLNAVIGAAQRFKAEQAVRALERTSRPQVRVTRESVETNTDPEALVPGDLIRLEAGEEVPADCRIVSARGLEVDESTLTGESTTVEKTPERSAAADVAERTSMLYDGTTVAAGRTKAVVVAVGDDTEANRAASLEARPERTSGVEARLESLTKLTIPAAAASGGAIVLNALRRGLPITEAIASGVSLAVAAVPEGLPLLATGSQLAAARRLSQRGALVRNARSIESLGRTNVLCADKTGTLTEGHLRLWGVSDGSTEAPKPELTDQHRNVLASALRASPRVHHGRKPPHPTDRALIEAGEDLGVTADTGAADWHKESELAFEPARGYHAVLGTTDGNRLVSVKGAPEVVLPRCRWDDADLDFHDAEDAVDSLARRGLRVLAVAERAATESEGLVDGDVNGLEFLGFALLSDPVRPAASDAIDGVRSAGVEVLMVTGDHPSTAEAIASELGLLDGNGVVVGAEIDELDDEKLESVVAANRVFARVTPAHKVRLVQALQRSGHVVAMTGDGANDAPAIRLADVGIALGSRATNAARQAADLVVTDDRIETIVDAILEGRALWASVREAVAILVGGNLGEIAFTLGGSLIGGRPPLAARQLLIVNLLTDVAPALAIALRPTPHRRAETLLHEGPEASLGAALNRAIAARAIATAAGTGAAWGLASLTGTPRRARTVALVSLVGTQMGQTLMASRRDPVVVATGIGSMVVLAGIVQTPGVSHLFGCTPLGPVGWTIGLASSAAGTGASVLVARILDKTFGPGD